MNKYVFGIDVGGTTIKCGLFSSKGEVLESWEIVTNKADNGDHIIANIAETIQAKCEEKGIQIILCTHSRHLLAALGDSGKIIWMKDGKIKDEKITNLIL